jgi:hypothetical protein
MRYDETTRDKLSGRGLTEVAAHLWAGDWQSCQQPLGSACQALAILRAAVSGPVSPQVFVGGRA